MSRYCLDMNKNHISQVPGNAQLSELTHPKQTRGLRQTRASGSQFAASSLSTKSGENSAGNSSLKVLSSSASTERSLFYTHTRTSVIKKGASCIKSMCQQVSQAIRKRASLGSSHQNFLEVLNPHWHSDLQRIDR